MKVIDHDRLMQPHINLNGLPREAHVERRTDAMAAVRDAMEKLGETRPHMRDYIEDVDGYIRDLDIYANRFAMLDKLHNELYDEAMDIQGDL